MPEPRIAVLQRSLPFFTWYASSPHGDRQGEDGVVDLLFGWRGRWAAPRSRPR